MTALDPRVHDEGRQLLTHRTTCRACGGATLHRFLELGNQPLANSFLRSADEAARERRFPLDVYFCTSCSLVQLADVIDPEVLFGDYIYVTGTSTTIAAHNRRYARAVVDELLLGHDDLVVEIASNDGSLLSCFRDLGVRILGVEPARNIASGANARGIPTDNRFFTREAGPALRATHGKARAVIGNNVLAHVDDTQGFLRGAADLIDTDGAVIVEVPYATEMLTGVEYDTVYHEHLCYFSVTALARLAELAGLGIVRVDDVPVHGGSVRVWFRPGVPHAAAVERRLVEEQENGLATLAAWEAFAQASAEQRRDLLALLRRLRSEGKRVVGYGAPAKGNTLLNYCGITPELLAYTVDRNPWKVGKLTPGVHLPVRPVETLIEEQPDYVLILAWNFAEEVMEQQAAYRAAGGQFIIPIPSPRII
ncbi:MAG: class I SAM-dependent methyltransferase [Gemmatimonadaceae bacterium]|nr:class I SAM-dependent methyltransferase [Gemmatimonadaceae bacterium]